MRPLPGCVHKSDKFHPVTYHEGIQGVVEILLTLQQHVFSPTLTKIKIICRPIENFTRVPTYFDVLNTPSLGKHTEH